jgi:hypothetical protein
MKDRTLEHWLIEEIEMMDHVARESYQFAHNSYGSGYDRGVVDGLKLALEQLREFWGSTMPTVKNEQPIDSPSE